MTSRWYRFILDRRERPYQDGAAAQGPLFARHLSMRISEFESFIKSEPVMLESKFFYQNTRKVQLVWGAEIN